MLEAIEKLAQLTAALVNELESSDTNRSTSLNSDGDFYQDEASDEVAELIDDIETLLPMWFSEGTDLNEQAVNLARTYDLEVRTVTRDSEYKDDYDFVLCTSVVKIYFN